MLSLPLVFLATPACSQEPAAAVDEVGAFRAAEVDEAAAFRAAGFSQVDGQWRQCDAPSDSIYTPGAIEQLEDLNADGRPEVIITEGSTFCYGGDEVGFFLVSQQADSSWKLMLASPGVATVLTTKGTGGWPDIEVGGQGFCFPVQRWNGTEYDIARFQYEGEACHQQG
jgi:hypothetical protein